MLVATVTAGANWKLCVKIVRSNHGDAVGLSYALVSTCWNLKDEL